MLMCSGGAHRYVLDEYGLVMYMFQYSFKPHAKL